MPSIASGVPLNVDSQSLVSVSIELRGDPKLESFLEGVVADDLWPLPTYQEMLFIK